MIALLGVFTSCSNDEDAAPPVVKLTVTNATTTYEAGALVPVTVEVSSTVNLTSLEFKFAKGTVGANSAVTKCTPEGFEPANPKGAKVNFKAKTTGSLVVDYSIQLPADAAAGELEVTVTATDENAKTTVATAKIKVGSLVNTYTTKVLGAHENSNGSFFASIDGTVYKVADAKTNAAKVDIVYFYGATNKATLASPSDASVEAFTTYGVTTWSKRNKTLVKEVTLTAAEFDALTYATMDKVGTATTTLVNNLAKDKYVAFKSESGQFGVIKITNITEGTTGTIELTIKVQKATTTKAGQVTEIVE
jgi:hypothetical protein